MHVNSGRWPSPLPHQELLNCREGLRCCLADKISLDIPIGAARNIYSFAPDFDDRAVCYSPVVAGGDHSRKSGKLCEVVLHVNRQVFHVQLSPETKQHTACWYPGSLQDALSAPHAHQMNIRRHV